MIAVADETATHQEAPVEEKVREEKETPEEIKKRSRKPPSDGRCVICLLTRPINRLKMCYPCWVQEMLKQEGWRDGQPHPDSCGCEGLGEHQAHDGTSQGSN